MIGNNGHNDILTEVIAGSATAVFQTTLTQPFEYVKTAAQLRRSLKGIKYVVNVQPVKTYFIGSSILNIGAVLKTTARFGTFEQVCRLLRDPDLPEDAPLPGLKMALAGIITGTVESLWIIPFENVKTRMIENSMILEDRAASATNAKVETLVHDEGVKSTQQTFHKPSINNEALNPRFKSFMQYEKQPSEGMYNTIKEMYQTRGFQAFIQGSMPTMFRQIGNSVVRFSTYTTLRQMIASPNEPLHESLAFLLGAVSAISIVAVTQPIDVIKTRMQSKYAWREYRNSLNCCYRTFVEEGYLALWKGTIPRSFKVGLSGGISFSIYQYFENLINLMRREGYLKKLE